MDPVPLLVGDERLQGSAGTFASGYEDGRLGREKVISGMRLHLRAKSLDLVLSGGPAAEARH